MYKYDAESKLIKSYVYDSETMTNSFGADVIYDLQSRVSSVQLTFDYVAPSGTYVESYMLVYIYDENGSPIGMKYRTPSMAQDVYECFFFEKNLQGDIVSVYNSSGVKVIAYTYDAWGNCTTSYPNGYSGITGATYNPFRYRGYYYDIETGFYYLQSRYYNPACGRFLNADGLVSTGQGLLGYNMYAYCNNNPIMYVDSKGDWPWLILLIVAGGVAILSGCSSDKGNVSAAPETSSKEDEPSNFTYKSSSLAVCTDGIGSAHNDIYHQNSTAYMGGTLNADVHHYVVIPTDHPNYRDTLGCVAVVIDKNTGNYIFAVVGDGGPKGKYGEVSISVVWDLGYSSDGSYGPDGNFEFIIFPNTRKKWNASNLNEQLYYSGIRLYAGRPVG